jgi:hypothetical protein
MRVENAREFGGPWLAWQLIRRLGLDEFLRKTIATGDEEVPWSVMALVLVIARLCRPSSELYIAEHFYRGSALSDLLGVADEKINDSRLYRALDVLLPHKWQKITQRRDWATLSAPPVADYLLRSNVRDWSDAELWQAYIQLTEAESAFRIEKSDLSFRPIWHHKEHRVRAHILVCFLAYVLWKTLERWMEASGLGTAPRTLLDEVRQLKSTDVILPTAAGRELRLRCVSQPDDSLAVLLYRLGIAPPARLAPPHWTTDQTLTATTAAVSM